MKGSILDGSKLIFLYPTCLSGRSDLRPRRRMNHHELHATLQAPHLVSTTRHRPKTRTDSKSRRKQKTNKQKQGTPGYTSKEEVNRSSPQKVTIKRDKNDNHLCAPETDFKGERCLHLKTAKFHMRTMRRTRAGQK